MAASGEQIHEPDFVHLAQVRFVDDVPLRDNRVDVEPQPADVGEREIALQPVDGRSVGVIADERANPEQRDAIAAIASGSGGGPMAALGSLVGKFLGVETAPIEFDRKAATWSVKASNKVDMAAAGAMGINPNATEPLHLDNTGHPAADRIALARASQSHVHALGFAWDDVSGKNNGQYAPFSWRSA